jgi:hypothetical protein
MIDILGGIVGALTAGAIAKGSEVGGKMIADAYEGLRSLIVRKLGKAGAVQSVEDDPGSASAQAALAEAMTKAGLADDKELEQHANAVRAALSADLSAGAEIDIGHVTAKATALIENLVATGRIKIANVQGENVSISGLTAGSPKT